LATFGKRELLRKLSRRPIRTAVLLLWAALAPAVFAPAVAQQYTFRGYGQSDGLGNLSVGCLVQDRAGYLWVCTENGLYRHDGREFERLGENDGLQDTEVHSVVVDAAGRLWVGTAHDLYLFDGQRFAAVRPNGHALSVAFGARLATAPNQHLWVIDGERLLELTPAGARSWNARPYFDEEQRESIPALDHLSALYGDARGRLWLGCGTRICSVDHGEVSYWGEGQGVPEDGWHTWAVDAHQHLWVRGLKHVLMLDSVASRFVSRDPPHAEITSQILNVPLVDDGHGSLLTRTDVGLARWQRDHWEEITMDSGLPTTAIAAMLSTRDGTVWLGMSGSGLYRWLGYGTLESWTARRGPDRNPVWVMVRGADGTITLGSRSGCLHIETRTRTTQPCDFEGVSTNEIQVLARDWSGNLWLGDAIGRLQRVAAGERRAVTVAEIPLMRKLFVDSDGRLWISSNTSLQVIQPGSTELSRESLPEGLGAITDIAEDERGILWIATQGGLLQRTNGAWRLLQLPTPAAEGFSSVVAAGGGWYWAGGASHGLMRLHVSGGKADFAQWQTAPNIAAAGVEFVHVDRRGWLWAGTDAGVVVYDGKQWRRFNQEDGLIWNDIDQNSVYEDEDGSIWIGTSGGLVHVLRPEALLNNTLLDLRIAAMTVGTQRLDNLAGPVIPWHRDLPLDVRLQELNFSSANRIVLKVRLRGLSDEWFRTRDFNVHYPALAPGQYTFEVVAEDPDQQRTSAVIRRDFEVLPPWWQTNGFRALATLVLFGTLAATWRWSVMRLERRRRTLERELREREALLERATRDPLTRLWNRQAILENLMRAMESAQANRRPLAVALIDIDHFKRVNDTMGHLVGDLVLRSIAEQVTKGIRAGDSLGRYGGEELLLILPDATEQRPFLPIERLQRTIAKIPFVHDGARFHVTASFGVAWFARGGESMEELIGRADEMLYVAKERGRNRVEYALTGT
jgi:diguanylate cyclase (GGDEF)-like protein